MSAKAEEYREKIERILEWADEKDRGFDTEFVESLENHLDRFGELTVDQQRALDNIIDRWNIPE